MTAREPIHAVAWATWVLAVVVTSTTTRNPVYLFMILLWIAIVAVSVRLTQPLKADAVPLSPLRFGLIVIPLATLFNALSVHFGSTVVATLPSSIPYVGGPITLEAMVYGALNGIVLTGLFTAFLVLNWALTVRALVGLIPRAYYPIAVIVSIAITFVPMTLAQFQRVREAQAIRGHQVKGIRSWLPLLLPLLMSGMERALQLAEAMTARGFANANEDEGNRAQIAMITGLTLAGIGVMMQMVWHLPTVGRLLILIGAALVLGTLWSTGRRNPKSTYRPAPIRPLDWVIIGAALLLICGFLLPIDLIDRESIYYYPYPTLTLPTFHVGIGMATWALLMPAFVLFFSGGRAK